MTTDSATAEHSHYLASIAEELRTDCYIDGRWRPSSDGSLIAVADPSTGQTLAHVANGTVSDAALAADAASRAMPTWSATAPARGPKCSVVRSN